MDLDLKRVRMIYPVFDPFLLDKMDSDPSLDHESKYLSVSGKYWRIRSEFESDPNRWQLTWTRIVDSDRQGPGAG